MPIKTFSLADYVLFCEKVGEFQTSFEFVDLQIQDKFTGQNLPADLVEYVLNNKIEYFPNFYEMTMATFKHRRIIRNTRTTAEEKSKGKGIVFYSEGCNVLMLKGNVRFPDIVVADKKNEIMDKYYNLMNPLAAFEVLSPSTAHIDLTQKLAEYQVLPSLQTYIIISQDMPKVWQYSRTKNGQWLLEELENMNDCIGLDFLPEPVFVFLKEIYEDIEF